MGSAATTQATTRSPQSASGRFQTATSATPGWAARMLSTATGHTFSAPGDDDLSHPTVHDQTTVGSERATVSGGQPSAGQPGIVPVAIGPQQHGAADQDLAARSERAVPQPDLGALEGHAVVDQPRTGLGHAVGGDDVAGERGGGRRPAEQDDPVARGVGAAEGRRHQGDQVVPSWASCSTARASNRSWIR